MKNSTVLFVLIIGLLSSCQSTNETTKVENPLVQAISYQLDTLLMDSTIHAVSLGIIKDGEVYKFHDGKLLNGESPNDASLYEIASLTKTFTGTLLAEAVNEGKIKLDDDIRQYLPDELPNLAYDNQPITVRNLVTHQSGIPRMFPHVEGLFDSMDWDNLPTQINELQEGFSKDDFYAALAKISLDTVPGHHFNYSNAGANLVGIILENIYEKSYETLLQEKIFTKLNMNNSTISLDEDDKKRIAYGQNHNGVKMPIRADKHISAEGGILSNVDDMLAYLNYHLDTENPIIKTAHQPLWNGQYGDFDTGYFWQLNKDGDNPDRIFQNGGAYGMSSYAILIPEHKLGIFIVTNVAGPTIHQQLGQTVEGIISALNDVEME